MKFTLKFSYSHAVAKASILICTFVIYNPVTLPLAERIMSRVDIMQIIEQINLKIEKYTFVISLNDNLKTTVCTLIIGHA